ncbi:DNA repair protein-like protein Rad26 [Xylogone sp. PMI_703]|nr:DNA repair protein-like protein Rad26 [Xylogone sp. PMI_703]
MTAGNFDGDDFDDDALDLLPANALEELENNAIRYTQAQTQAVHLNAPPSSDYGDDFEDDDLDDAVVIDEAKSTPAVTGIRRNILPYSSPKQNRRPQWDNLAGNTALTATLANRQRLNGSAAPPVQSSRPVSNASSRTHAFSTQPDPLPNLEDLQKQIDELRRERNELIETVNAKAGEIAIVRSKQEQTVKQYEKELANVRKLNTEQLAKQEKALEAAKIAEKHAAIERDFIKQDLAEESERVRRLNRAREIEKKEAAGIATTPKKKKTLTHRDGFDDDEIEVLSPSKLSPSRLRRTVASPSKLAGKRKRKVDSPVAALDVIQTDEAPKDQDHPKPDIIVPGPLPRPDDRLDFIGLMLDHRPRQDHLRTMEALSKYAFPSSPEESLASIIFGRLPSLGMKRSVTDLPIEFCELLVSLWAQCVEEKYLKPIYLLTDMLTLAIELKTLTIAPHIVDCILPVIQRTADYVAIPRFNKASPAPYDEDINVSNCLSLMHLVALGCMSEKQYITRFWKLVRWDFILMILSQNQLIEDFEMMLQILSTSILNESFGAIAPDETAQGQHTSYIIDRLSYPLFEVPYLPGSTVPLEADIVQHLRLKILYLLISMTRSPYSSRALAFHPNAIARIVSLIVDEIDALYDYSGGHSQSAQLITHATRLLYYIVTEHEHIIDLQKKLAAVRGGSQKYLLALTRLNFSEEDLVLESEIEPDVPGLALELLEMVVTPEEGDAIQAAFSGD